MIQAILDLYKTVYPVGSFYENLLRNIKTWPAHHISNNLILEGYTTAVEVAAATDPFLTKPGDIRVDLPVWFGNAKTSQKRIVILGMEPRDTDKAGWLNIEKVNQYVFATPFAIERPKGVYHSAFSELITSDAFVYFTDVVKTYLVATGDKIKDDKNARINFKGNAERGKEFLLKELDIINPTIVIALGNAAHHFLSGLLDNKYKLTKVRHPANGGAIKARYQIKELLEF